MNTLQRRVLLTGSLARLSTEGSGLAIVVLALERTGGVARAGVLLACATLPQLVTGPLVGAWLDSTRRPGVVLVGAVATTTVAIGGLAADRSLGVAAVACALVLASTAPALTGGLSAGFARLAGGPGEVASVIAWDAVAYNVAGLAGPAIVTVLTMWFGATVATVALTIGVATAIPSMAPAWRVEVTPSEPSAPRAPIGAALALIVRHPELRSVTVATTVAFLGIGGLSIAAAAAATADGRAGEDAGQLVSAIALGALAGSLWWTRRPPSGSPARTVTLATAATGLVLVTTGVGPWPAVLTGAIVVGVLDAPVLIGTFAARHAASPLAVRSSVFTVGASLKLAASAIGALVAGWSLDDAVTAAGLTAVGVVHLVAAGLGWWVLVGRRTMPATEREGTVRSPP